MVRVDSEAAVRSLEPDFAAVRDLGARGVIVTAVSDGPYDVVSRYFAPAAGIDEDPVTGSAHCCLGPYWLPELGRTELRCFQASQRGGEMTVRQNGERVTLDGKAITVFRVQMTEIAAGERARIA